MFIVHQQIAESILFILKNSTVSGLWSFRFPTMYDQMYVGVGGTKSSLYIKQVGSEMIYKQINDYYFILFFPFSIFNFE